MYSVWMDMELTTLGYFWFFFYNSALDTFFIEAGRSDPSVHRCKQTPHRLFSMLVPGCDTSDWPSCVSHVAR
jgi:hypothetical protein